MGSNYWRVNFFLLKLSLKISKKKRNSFIFLSLKILILLIFHYYLKNLTYLIFYCFPWFNNEKLVVFNHYQKRKYSSKIIPTISCRNWYCRRNLFFLGDSEVKKEIKNPTLRWTLRPNYIKNFTWVRVDWNWLVVQSLKSDPCLIMEKGFESG